MVKDVRHKFSFDAIDDDGQTHILHVFVDIIDGNCLDSSGAEIEGLKSIKTDGGDPVNRLG